MRSALHEGDAKDAFRKESTWIGMNVMNDCSRHPVVCTLQSSYLSSTLEFVHPVKLSIWQSFPRGEASRASSVRLKFGELMNYVHRGKQSGKQETGILKTSIHTSTVRY